MSLNAHSLNAAALNAILFFPEEEDGNTGSWVTQSSFGCLGGATLNTRVLNGVQTRRVFIPGEADVIVPQFELRTVYLLEVGGARIPMGSFQATTREEGLSYLQAVIPNGSSYIDSMETDAPMRVMMGYRAPDDSLTALEEIAAAPLQTIRHDVGGSGDTLSISGYGELATVSSLARDLEGVSYRSSNQGRRRVRCTVDLLLRPGHIATDSDGVSFNVGQIQYFINARNEFMEVLERG